MVAMGRNGDGLVRVGILGCGNVGTALVRLLDANADLITRRSGVRIEVATDAGFASEYYEQLQDVFAKQKLAPTYGLVNERISVMTAAPAIEPIIVP